MKTLFTALVIVFMPGLAFCQISFSKIFLDDQPAYPGPAIQTSDGGYALCGSVFTQNGSVGTWLIRTNPFGDTLWTKTYAGPPKMYESVFSETDDDGFIICGNLSESVNTDIVLTRTNSTGDTIWTRKLPNGTGNAIALSEDGGYLIAGKQDSATLVIKTDENGYETWRKIYHPSGNTGTRSYANSIEETDDFGSVVIGNCNEYPTAGDTKSIFMIRLNSNGDSLWGKIYNHVQYQLAMSGHQIPGGYIICGQIDTNGSFINTNAYIIRTDNTGDTLWTKANGNYRGQYYGSLQQTNDGGFIACGGLDDFDLQNVLLDKLDSSGGIIWSRQFPFTSGISVRQTTDNGYILGVRYVSPSNEYGLGMIKTDENGLLAGIGPSSGDEDSWISANSPNPFSEQTTITYRLDTKSPVTLEIFSVTGKLLKTLWEQPQTPGIHALTVHGADIPSGIYIYHVHTSDKTGIGKMIVSH